MVKPGVPCQNVIDVLDVLSEYNRPCPLVEKKTDDTTDQVENEVVDLLNQGSPIGQTLF